jgi:hypothetical protein
MCRNELEQSLDQAVKHYNAALASLLACNYLLVPKGTTSVCAAFNSHITSKSYSSGYSQALADSITHSAYPWSLVSIDLLNWWGHSL